MIRRAALLLPLMWVLIYTGARWMHPGPLEYGEGVNLLWQQQVEQGKPLYPEVQESTLPWVHNPYPPLGPVLLAAAETAVPLPHLFAAGRSLSWLAIAVCAVMLWRAAPLNTFTDKAVLILLFLASPVPLRAASLMRVDALALAAALGSFFLLKSSRTSLRWALSGLLAVCAVLLKPSFAGAGVVLLFRLIQDRSPRAGGMAVLGGALPLISLGTWLFLREDPNLMLHLIDLQKLPRFPDKGFELLAGFSATHALLLTAGLLAYLTGGERLREERLYLAASLTVLALTLSIQGAHSGYVLEVLALLCLGAATLPLTDRRSTAILIALQFLMFIPWETPPVFSRTYGQEEEPGKVQAFWPGQKDRDIAQTLSEELRTADGPVLSTSPGLALMAGREVRLQVFQFSALIEAEDWDAAALVTALEHQEFDRILLKGNAEHGDDPYLPEDLQRVIAEQYSLHRALGPWHLYRR